MRVDFNVAMEVAAHEALVRQTYKDSKGVLTWCVGMTNATGHRVERYIGRPQPLQHCMNIYAWALTNYARQVQEAFAARPLTQAQFAAAVSFHWNTGAIKRATWVRYWLRGEDEKARSAFMNWITPKEVAARRGKERDLFFDGVWSNDGTMTEFTRVRASMAPDWSSGIKINVATELRKAFEQAADVVLDQQPEPDAVPAGPTLSPEGGEPDGSFTPIIIEDDTMASPKTGLTPIEQTNKANRAALGAAAGGGAIGPGIVYLWSLTDHFPEVWANDPQALIILTGFASLLFAPIGAWLEGYRAPDKRFQN